MLDGTVKTNPAGNHVKRISSVEMIVIIHIDPSWIITAAAASSSHTVLVDMSIYQQPTLLRETGRATQSVLFHYDTL